MARIDTYTILAPMALLQLVPWLEPLPFDLLGRLALAVLLGGIVGVERELSGKPAGLRTNILICLGSALLMDLSITIGMTDGDVRIGDPARIAAQVVTGVGFLGAGTIMQARGEVVGLTTAATIWVVAAIGLAVGAGHRAEAVAAALLVTLVLTALGWLERWMLSFRRVVNGTVRLRRDARFEEITPIFRGSRIAIQSKKVMEEDEGLVYRLQLVGPSRQYDRLAEELMHRPEVMSVEFD
ncbi:MAG TPA: MgtC/SapB family protein [Gemmatimonadaceae bacterium]|nr:MgtC/SapB family protein [Gemmatimonadaceae bacterium]